MVQNADNWKPGEKSVQRIKTHTRQSLGVKTASKANILGGMICRWAVTLLAVAPPAVGLCSTTCLDRASTLRTVLWPVSVGQTRNITCTWYTASVTASSASFRVPLKVLESRSTRVLSRLEQDSPRDLPRRVLLWIKMIWVICHVTQTHTHTNKIVAQNHAPLQSRKPWPVTR